jgi:enoyl-CoA hydratase/carnithine racemase
MGEAVRYQSESGVAWLTMDRPEGRNALSLEVRQGLMSWKDALDEVDRLFEPVYLSEDAQEGPRAFLEKREPHWRAR